MKTPLILTPAATFLLASTFAAQALAQPKPGAPPAAPAAVQPADNGPARREMKRARDLLAQHSSVQARLVESVAILDRSFKAEGRYLQGHIQGKDHRVRLEMTLKIGRSEGTLLEVCDGDILWTRHEVGDKDKKEPTITRRNVTQILDAARKRGGDTETLLIADLGLGGLPALLASLERSMTFSNLKKDTLRNRPVNVIQGTWNNEFLARFRDPAKPAAEPAPLPVFVPDQVELSLDRETGFPHRIQYLKKFEDRETLRPMLTLDFIDVVLNQPINKSEFVFVPPDRPAPIEITPAYLQQLLPKEPSQGAAPPATPAK